MTDFTKGGRGKKAPYETVHYRVPKPLKSTVQKLSNTYRNSLKLCTIVHYKLNYLHFKNFGFIMSCMYFTDQK